jgi:hypothetical protein
MPARWFSEPCKREFAIDGIDINRRSGILFFAASTPRAVVTIMQAKATNGFANNTRTRVPLAHAVIA